MLVTWTKVLRVVDYRESSLELGGLVCGRARAGQAAKFASRQGGKPPAIHQPSKASKQSKQKQAGSGRGPPDPNNYFFSGVLKMSLHPGGNVGQGSKRRLKNQTDSPRCCTRPVPYGTTLSVPSNTSTGTRVQQYSTLRVPQTERRDVMCAGAYGTVSGVWKSGKWKAESVRKGEKNK